MAWTRVASGDLVRADDINDIQKALDGTVGKAQIMSFTQVDDSASYALNVQNKDSTNSRIARFLNSAGTVVLGIVKEAVNVSKQIVSTVATGTAPFSVASTTLVSNLNADLLDGNHASAFALSGTGVTGGNSHDHVGGDGAAIAEAALAAAVAAKLVTNGNSHDHVGGDGAAIPAGGLANGAVDATARLANDIVDDTKVGNRVPQFIRRQGGDASNWAYPGAGNYTPGAVRMQGGVQNVFLADGETSGSTAITFPVAFSMPPIVLVSVCMDGVAYRATIAYPVGSGVTLMAYRDTGSGAVWVTLHWLAIGPE